MSWFKRKSDPISERARALSEQIAALDAEIMKLGAKIPGGPGTLRAHSTALPRGASVPHTMPAPEPPKPVSHEPIFEDVDRKRLDPMPLPTTTPEHFNDFGVRKFDLPALLRRTRETFHGPTTSNPKLVSYLAAGGIRGLQPLRKEKRVARNRFIVFAIGLLLALVGVIYVFIHNH